NMEQDMPIVSVDEVIRRAENGDCGPVIEAIKRFVHNQGVSLGVSKQPYQGPPGPEPTLSELYQLSNVLQSRFGQANPLYDFMRWEQARPTTGIRASGFVLSEPFSLHAWNDAALKLDEWLNTLREPEPRDGPAAPNLLWWKNAWHELPPRQWAILNYCWDKDKAQAENVIAHAWRDEGETVADSTVRS